MRNNRYAFILCLLLFFITKGEATELSFSHLTTKDGLSHNSVISMYQDERGFVWFGTRNGVNLYNGNEFTTYKYDKDNANTIINNNILQIVGDKQGSVYFLTTQGISAFSISSNKFTTLIQGKAYAMFYHKQLYISRENAIYLSDGKRFALHYELPHKDAKITALYISDEITLIGTEQRGVFMLDKHKKCTHLIPQGTISSIFKDSTGKYWIGTWEDGLYQLSGKKLVNLRNDPNNPNSLSSNFVRCFNEDKLGNIWIGTFKGLNRFNPHTRTFLHYQKQDRENSLTHSSIWSLICDKQGTIWVGTYFGGINYFNPQYRFYQLFQSANNEREGLSSSIVGRMTEDKYHNLWICTEGGGLNQYNRQTGTFRWYQADGTPNSLSHNNVKSIYYDKQQEVMWIGTHMGGLNKLDIRSGRITHYLTNSNEASALSNIIRDIIPYKGQLILGTHRGIFLFNPQNGESTPLLGNDKEKISYILNLLIDHQNTLWIAGTENGTYAYQLDTKTLTNYRRNHALKQSICSNSINRVYEDSQHRLWFCSNESGIDLYHPKSNDFENFDVSKNGLASNCVYDACELSPERILFITDDGFSILNTRNRKFENYNRKNGVPLSVINERALYKASNGEIFIGGLDGMISFREKEIDYRPGKYTISPFRLFINGEEVEVNDATGVLQQALTETREIVLKSDQSMFTIEYAISNYIPFNRDRMEYRLNGFSNTWTDIRKEQHSITYTNLNPGKYTLIVRAKDNPNVVQSVLEIEILPPFYATAWAYFIYILCVGTLLYYLVRIYNNRIKLQESLKYEQKHTEEVERMNQAKLRFFTNISHEFRTPLTLIIGQMEMLLQVRSFAPTVYNTILGAYKSSLQLRELITELLDFRKQEQGYMTIRVSEHNIVDFVYENYLLFQEYAQQQKIVLKFVKTQDTLSAWYDTKQMQKVINNLISNSFKHTKKEGGEITVSVRKGNREIIIEVTDNGSGITPKDMDKIFDRFHQTETADTLTYIGTGIGLSLTKGIVELHHGTIEVYSNPGEETTFSIHLKTGNEHFTPEQICEPKEITTFTPENEHQNTQQFMLEQEMLNNEPIQKNKDYKILIVEDNEQLRTMLTKLFDTFYTVSTATNGREGLEKVDAERPNIVLSDIVMPEMSGTELCKAIKGNIETCHIPVVLLTAKTDIEYNLEGLRIGADDYITKPFNINILLSRCNNLVNNRVMLQEKFSKQPQTTPQILATNSLDKEFVDRAMTIIEEHLDNMEFNVDIFAREMGIARTKLFIKLKEITGQTPYDFILTIRLKRAAILLKSNPELSVSDISDRLGFSSPRQFSKSFKEKYQVVPQAYKKGDATDNIDEEEEEK